MENVRGRLPWPTMEFPKKCQRCWLIKHVNNNFLEWYGYRKVLKVNMLCRTDEIEVKPMVRPSDEVFAMTYKYGGV